MKNVILLLIFLGMTSGCPVLADCVAEIIGHDIDNRGNIVIKSQYKVDGVEVASRYPKLDGKQYFVTRYSAENFIGLGDAEIEGLIKKDLSAHCNSLTRDRFAEKSAETQESIIRNANRNLSENGFDKLVGKKITVDSFKIKVDTDIDGMYDQEWDIKTDGTKTSSSITPLPYNYK